MCFMNFTEEESFTKQLNAHLTVAKLSNFEGKIGIEPMTVSLQGNALAN